MLRGKNYIRLTAVIILAAFPLWVYLNRGSEEFAQQILVWLFIGLFFLILSDIRAGRARRTIRKLRRYGELGMALADLNGEDVYRIPRPSYSSEQIADNVLGEKFIFLFSCGRIIRYYQIKRLLIWRGANKLQLIISDATGKTYPLAELSPKGEAGLTVCLHQLRTRYPGCPVCEKSDREIFTL